MTKVLIVGGAGYLGSMLARSLLGRGFDVRILDNLMYGEESLRSLESRPEFELMRGDVRDMRAVVKGLDGVDGVIHLASIVGDQAADLDSRSTMEINYLATKNLVELCNLYKVKRLLYASTCSVYGESKNGVSMDENFEREGGSHSSGPISLYGETKLKSEKAIQGLSDDGTILRLGTLFGLSERMRFDLALNLFIAKGIAGDKITVFGGNQFRPFLHVLDAADAFIHALEKNLTGIYNVAWRNLKLIEAADLVRKQLGAQVEISDKIVDRRNYAVKCDKIIRTGFKPNRDVELAINEIKGAFARGKIVDYKLPKYSNYKLLAESDEVRRKVYTLGPIGEKMGNTSTRK